MANTMANNSKRRAFTIVELVIVIAVIAILATVLITTFTGVIQSANVSADKQLLSSLNTQISMYIGKGNEINTAEDIKVALNSGDIDYWEKLDPKSASYGYHYWYNPTEQKIELATYDELGNANIKAEPIGKFLGEVTFPKARIAEGFEASSPRALKGYYFLDVVGENNNVIATFYDEIEKMSMDGADYAKSLKKLELSDNDKNKTLANAIIEKMSQTAIVTNKGVFINAATTEQVITNIYIPENLTDNKDNYYLSCEVVNVKNENVNDLTKFNNINVGTITLPENVKVGEGALDVFGEVNVNVNITVGEGETLAGKFEEIFSAESVNGTVTVNGSNTVEIEGNKVTGDFETTLEYVNPVTEKVEISVDGNVVNGYIALNKIKDGSINLDLLKNTLMSGAKLAYNQNVEWEVVGNPAGVSVEDGKVKISNDFAGAEIKIKAYPVAVNAEAQREALASDPLTLKVVKVNAVDFDFGATEGLDISGNPTVSLKYSNASTTAKFSGMVLYYTLMDGTALTPFTPAEIETLGAPEVTMTTTGTYFTIGAPSSNEYKFNFKTDALKNITGKVTETVTVTVAEVGTYTVNVKIEPTIFKAVHVYKNNYKYTVGNANEITLEKLFGLSDFFADKAANFNGKVQIKTYNADPDYVSDGVYQQEYVSGTDYVFTADATDWKKSTLKLTKLGATAVEISTTGDNAVSFIIEVNVVDGKNITPAEFSTISSFKNPITYSVVLHDNLSGFAPSNGPILSISGANLYGNYFTIDASAFKDADGKVGSGLGGIIGGILGGSSATSTSTGYTFINLTNGSLNQVVLKGPVYPEAAIMDKLDTAGYFCFGIGLYGTTVTINDSYLSGFDSPVYDDANTLNANNTTFEGGVLANVYIRSVNTVNFDNVKTIQNRVTGYNATIDGKTNAMLGMGIFIHEDQNDVGTLTLNLKDVEQYNWLNESNKSFGGYVKTAIETIYKDAQYSGFMHNVDGVNYVNAAIAYVNKDKESKVIINTSATSGKPHAYHDGTGEGSDGSGQSGSVWVATYECDGTCCNSEKVNYTTGNNFGGGITEFLKTRVN